MKRQVTILFLIKLIRLFLRTVFYYNQKDVQTLHFNAAKPVNKSDNYVSKWKIILLYSFSRKKKKKEKEKSEWWRSSVGQAGIPIHSNLDLRFLV